MDDKNAGLITHAMAEHIWSYDAAFGLREATVTRIAGDLLASGKPRFSTVEEAVSTAVALWQAVMERFAALDREWLTAVMCEDGKPDAEPLPDTPVRR